MPIGELNSYSFSFYNEISESSLMQYLKKLILALNYINFVDKDFLPTFKSFKIRKIPITGQVMSENDPSYILCLVDLSVKNKAQNSINGEKELVALVNSSISHEMRNPLNVVINQSRIVDMLCTKFSEVMEKLTLSPEDRASIWEFFTQINKSNIICSSQSDKLQLNIEDLMAYAQLKAGTFFKMISPFNLKNCVSDVTKIVDYQAKCKSIEIESHFFGFPGDHN